MNVILLGAGASKAYSESPSKARMPLARDFFHTFRMLDIAENPWVLIGNIITYLKRFHSILPEEFEKYNGDIEDIHSEIEQKLNESLLRPDEAVGYHEDTNLYFKAYTELIYLFTSVINEIQNGPVSKAHINLASQLKSDDVIITFNWDTLMDKALYTTTNWNCFTGYFVKPVAIYRNQWLDSPKDNIANNFPLLLKLHGSTNWLTGAPIVEHGKLQSIQATNLAEFSVYESTIEPYSTYDGRYMQGYSDFAYGYYPVNLNVEGRKAPEGKVLVKSILRTPFTPKGTGPDSGLVSIPLIIPPVKNKAYNNFGDLFASLWSKAEESIRKADKIIIIGYSFPMTDIQSDRLFKNAFNQRLNMPKVIIVNPQPDSLEKRFSLDYGITSNNLSVYKDYFTEQFDLNELL